MLAGPGHPLRAERSGDPQQAQAVSLGPVTNGGREAEEAAVEIGQLVRGGGLTWEQQPPSGLKVVGDGRLGLRFVRLVIQSWNF